MLGWSKLCSIFISLLTVFLRGTSLILAFQQALIAIFLFQGLQMATRTSAYAPYPMTFPTMQFCLNFKVRSVASLSMQCSFYLLEGGKPVRNLSYQSQTCRNFIKVKSLLRLTPSLTCLYGLLASVLIFTFSLDFLNSLSTSCSVILFSSVSTWRSPVFILLTLMEDPFQEWLRLISLSVFMSSLMARWSLECLACVLLLSFITIKQQNKLYALKNNSLQSEPKNTQYLLPSSTQHWGLIYMQCTFFHLYSQVQILQNIKKDHLNLSTRIMVDTPRILQHPQKVAYDKCLSGVRQGSWKLSTEYWQGNDQYYVSCIGLRIYKQNCWFIGLGLIFSLLFICSKFIQVFILNLYKSYFLKWSWIKSFFSFSLKIPLNGLVLYQAYLGEQLNYSQHHPYNAAIYLSFPPLSLYCRARMTRYPIRLSFLLSTRQQSFERVPSILTYLKGYNSSSDSQLDRDQGCYLLSYFFMDSHRAEDIIYLLACQQQAETAEHVNALIKAIYPHFFIRFILIIIMPQINIKIRPTSIQQSTQTQTQLNSRPELLLYCPRLHLTILPVHIQYSK